MSEFQVAPPEEVLATFTRVMRGEKSSEQLKAAEQLAKYYSLFTASDQEGTITPEVVREVEAAVEAAKREIAGSGQETSPADLPGET